MTLQLQIPASLIPALRIFEAEMRAHLEYLAGFDKQALLSQLETADFRMNLLHRFHTIKGGSGFFGLEAIQKTSGSAEKLLQNKTDTPLEEIAHTILICVKDLQVALTELSAAMT